MAWAFVAHRGSASNKVSGAVLTVNPTATLAVGAVVVAVCVADNIATVGGVSQTHVVADFKGNLWRKVREHTNAGVAGAAITVSVWATQITTALLTTDQIVLGLSAATTAKAIGLYEYSVGAGSAVVFAGANSSEQDATSSPTVTLNSLPNRSYALFGVVAREADTAGTYTQDVDYNDRTKFGTTGGAAGIDVSAIVGDRVTTLTNDTFAPTVLSLAADVVSVLIAMYEVPAAVFTATSVSLAIAGNSFRLTIAGETVDIDRAYVAGLLAGNMRRLDHMILRIVEALYRDGVDTSDDAAITAYVNGRTWAL